MFNLFDKYKFHIVNLKESFLVSIIIFFMAVSGISIVFSDCCPIVLVSADINNNNNSSLSSILDNDTSTFVEQKTVISQPAPVKHPGQPSHEVVFALPLRDDGKV